MQALFVRYQFGTAVICCLQELLDPLIIHYPTELVAALVSVWGDLEDNANAVSTRKLIMEMVNAVDPNSPDAVWSSLGGKGEYIDIINVSGRS